MRYRWEDRRMLQLYVRDLQYPPRVILIVCNTSIALPPVYKTRVETRVVHRRVARVQLAAIDKRIHIGGVATVIFFGLFLASAS